MAFESIPLAAPPCRANDTHMLNPLRIALALAVSMSWVTAPAFGVPADQAQATDALKTSPRHGEFVDVALPNSQTKLKCFVAYPERAEKAPVVIVIHEIFGLTDWIRAVCDGLAAEGFIAIAPDMLSGMGEGGGGTEAFKGDAVRDAIRGLKPEVVTERLNSARDYATKLPAANGKSASVGFCWGGSMSFAYATQQPALAGAVVYYGSPPAASEMEKITCPVLGLYGKDDARITSTVDATKDSMQKLGKQYDAKVYDGAGHGFLRQQSGKDGANLKAAEEAWKVTITFLKDATE
jgi:carboxymethylenebutenolidase